MVQNRLKRRTNFWLFVLPALFLYGLFFIYPFFQGIRISFTNWDGLSQKSPISMPRGEFESTILNKITKQSDRAFLLKIYSLDPGDNQYKRLALTGWNRVRVDGIMKSVHWQAPGYREVGLKNYADILGGKLGQQFYPRRFTKTNYNRDSDLPAEIEAAEFEKNFLPHLSAAERALALKYYARSGGKYVLAAAYDEFSIEDHIYKIPEAADDGSVANPIDPSAIDALVAAVKTAGSGNDRAGADAAVAAFATDNRLSAESAASVKDAAGRIFDLGAFKNLLAGKWIEKQFDLGVVGFTLFFTVFTVILGNLLALVLALALDTGIKSKNVLRSVFFLPNVLSMVVVALIWSFVFFHIMPRLTGITTWMSDPVKAPWLIVLVAVWQASGYYMVIYLAGLQNIPTDVIEAATIDGASWSQRFRLIVMPLLAPAFTICLFLSTASALKTFDIVYAMVGPSGYALGTMPLVLDIFIEAFGRKNAGLATAKAIILFVVIFAVTGLQLRSMNKKEVEL